MINVKIESASNLEQDKSKEIDVFFDSDKDEPLFVGLKVEKIGLKSGLRANIHDSQ